MKFYYDNPKEIVSTLSAIKKTCATVEAREALRGIELTVKGDKLTMTALNGFALIQRVFAVSHAEDGSCCVDPNRLISAIDKNADDVKISLDGDFVVVDCGETVVRAKRICAEYIDHKQITGMEEYQRCGIHVNPQYLIKVLQAFCKSGRECVELVFDSNDRYKPIHVLNRNGDHGMVLPIRINK